MDNLYLILDESGNLHKNSKDRYFIIGGYLTNNALKARQLFKKELSTYKINNNLDNMAEVKGSMIKNYDKRNILLSISNKMAKNNFYIPVFIVIDKNNLEKPIEKVNILYNYFIKLLVTRLTTLNLINDQANLIIKLDNKTIKVGSINTLDELHPKSWTQDWRCSFFVSKLTREDKIKIYERRKNGETIPSLAKDFNVQESNIKYLIALIKKHGYNILREDKNKVYSKDFKLQTINRILINHESINSVAIDIGLTSSGILDNWLSKFKENGYNVVEKKKGRKPKSMTKLKKNDKPLSEKEKIKQLEEENLYLKAENEYLKKLKALVQERKLKEKKK